MAAFLNLLGKSKPAMLMQQVGCSVVPGWPAQHFCMSGVYSPIYSSSKWQWEAFSTCVSKLISQVRRFVWIALITFCYPVVLLIVLLLVTVFFAVFSIIFFNCLDCLIILVFRHWTVYTENCMLWIGIFSLFSFF